tara:strand:+ start:848 stop:1069 length:222 start_codon:yes stop_codon:yes gene_type:complete
MTAPPVLLIAFAIMSAFAICAYAKARADSNVKEGFSGSSISTIGILVGILLLLFGILGLSKASGNLKTTAPHW